MTINLHLYLNAARHILTGIVTSDPRRPHTHVPTNVPRELNVRCQFFPHKSPDFTRREHSSDCREFRYLVLAKVRDDIEKIIHLGFVGSPCAHGSFLFTAALYEMG